MFDIDALINPPAIDALNELLDENAPPAFIQGEPEGDIRDALDASEESGVVLFIGIAGELPDSPRAKVSSEDIGQRSYTREMRVQTTSHDVGSALVMSAPGVPRIFTAYVFGQERDSYALARSIEAERMGSNSLFWKVTIEYRTFSKAELLLQYENPLVQPPDIEISPEKIQRPVYFVFDAVTGKVTPCRNSAGQIFDPPPMREESRLVLTITRNEPVGDMHPLLGISYGETVNSDRWWGCDPGVWKCQGVSVRRENKMLQSGILYPYLRCTYKFEGRITWDTFLIDAGSYFLDDNDRRVTFTADDGHRIPGLLDGEGGQLASGKNPNYLQFRLHLRQPFAPLQLPQSFALGG